LAIPVKTLGFSSVALRVGCDLLDAGASWPLTGILPRM
jgi:hypothetical protein